MDFTPPLRVVVTSTKKLQHRPGTKERDIGAVPNVTNSSLAPRGPSCPEPLPNGGTFLLEGTSVRHSNDVSPEHVDSLYDGNLDYQYQIHTLDSGHKLPFRLNALKCSDIVQFVTGDRDSVSPKTSPRSPHNGTRGPPKGQKSAANLTKLVERHNRLITPRHRGHPRTTKTYRKYSCKSTDYCPSQKDLLNAIKNCEVNRRRSPELDDSDWDTPLHFRSLTLPLIGDILRSEGVQESDVRGQMKLLRDLYPRARDHRKASPKGRPSSRGGAMDGRKEEVSSLSSLDARLNASYPGPATQSGRMFPSLTQDGIMERYTTPASARRYSEDRRKRPTKADIVRARWLSAQQMEATLVGQDFEPPYLLILSNNVPKSKILLEHVVRHSSDILTVYYDFERISFDDLLAQIRRTLNESKSGCKPRSILFYTQGGPGYVYLLKHRVLTPQKLSRSDQKDLYWFWRELGDLVSKLRPEEAAINFMGCYVLGNKQGQELFDSLQQAVQPNIIRFDAPLEVSATGHRVLETYFDIKRYWVWKKHQYKNVDVIKWPISDVR